MWKQRDETLEISRSHTRYIVCLCVAFGFGCIGLEVFDPTANSSTRGKDKHISSNSDNHKVYVPSTCEKYIVDHAEELGYASWTNPSGCTIWRDINATNEEIYNQLQLYSSDLDIYNEAVRNFEPIADVMIGIKGGNYDVCASLKLHPDGLIGLFPSKQLSLTKSGYIEPLTPPMRSHTFCSNKQNLMSLDYLVHDYETMCRNLKPTSKRVLFDLGASLSFHGTDQPIVRLLSEYEKFGFLFDHIFAFEITFNDPIDVYTNLLPEKYFMAYHWINVGVNPEDGNKLNPINSILEKFDEDDFIVFKLDVDTAWVEYPLALQLLKGGTNGTYHRLVDQFYFEHHVHLKELAPYWGRGLNGTIKDSLDLFYGLRSKGIPSHFWP